MKTFQEFLMAQKESTAAKRAKNAAFMGLSVPGPEPTFDSGSTANPRLLDYYKKHVKKGDPDFYKKGKQPQVAEGSVNPGIDKWLDSIDKLKKELDGLPKDDEKDDLTAGLSDNEDGPEDEDDEDDEDEDDGEKEAEDDGYEPDDLEFEGPEDEEDDERVDDLDSHRMGLHLDKLKIPKPDKNPLHKDKDEDDEFGDWTKMAGFNS